LCHVKKQISAEITMRGNIAIVALGVGMATVWLTRPTRADEPQTRPTEIRKTETADQAIQAFDAEVSFSFNGASLTEALKVIGEKKHLEIQLDRAALKAAEIDPDAIQVTLTAKNISLRSALRRLLSPHQLACAVVGGELTVTTKAKADTTLLTRVYEVQDLLIRDEKGGVDYDSLIDLIVSMLAPPTWSRQGGSASIEPGPFGTLVVSQNSDVHEFIGDLFGAMRKLKDRVKTGDFDSCSIFDSPADQALRKALDLPVELDFHGTTLKDAINLAQQQGHVELQIDESAIKDATVDLTAATIDFNSKGAPLRTSLTRLLRPVSLTWLIKDEELLITTKDQADATLETVLYPIGDLLSNDGNSVDNSSDESPADIAARLEDDITGTIAPQTWANLGGPGTVQAYGDASAALVVSQTREVHDKVAELIAQLWEVRRHQQETVDKNVIAAKTPDTPVLCVYDLRMSAPNAPAMTAQEVADVVKSLVEPKSWSQGDVYIKGVTGKLVVQQLPGVQREIKKLLLRLDAVPINAFSGGKPRLGSGILGSGSAK
jgi:hypothetical protein